MKYLIKNKYWEINKEYNKEKLLYLLIDRPDCISKNNSFIWQNDKDQFCRDYDLPSFVWYDGSVSWYKNNKIHRENDKPARIYSDGYKECHINGKFIK